MESTRWPPRGDGASVRPESDLAPLGCVVNQEDAHLSRLRPLLGELDLEVVELQAPAGDLGAADAERFSGIISLGGGMGLHDRDGHPFLDDEISLLRSAHAAGVPVLGICLGGQLLASALGASVTPGGCREIGWIDVELLGDDELLGPAGSRKQLQWHYDSFDLPSGADRLAGSADCSIQAFRLGRSYGLQFHPETSVELLAQWAFSEEGRAELLDQSVDPDALVKEGRALDADCEAQARRIAAGFAGLVRRAAQ